MISLQYLIGGRVKCNGEFYKCTISNQGYYYLCGRSLHRIAAELFLPDYYEKCEIDHKDRNKLNNMVTNLLVCRDHKQNMNNPLTIQYRETHKSGKPIKPVLQYTKNNIFVAEYVSIHEASRQTRISCGNISRCCQHKKRYKSAGGYIWRYKKED